MRRSTLLTRALGTGALAAAATSLALVYVPVTTSAPRLDIVGALAAGAVLTAAWALACLTAPRLTAPVTSPPVEPAALPAQLPSPPRDLGRATGAALIALTPCTLAWLAMTGGTFIGSFLFFLTLFGTLKIATFLRRSASPKVFRDKVRVLIEDAAAGALLASLLCLPALLLGTDGLPALFAWLLCGLAAAAFVYGVLRGVGANPDSVVKDTEWTVRDEQDPSIT